MFDCGNIWLWYDIWYGIVKTLWAQPKLRVGYLQKHSVRQTCPSITTQNSESVTIHEAELFSFGQWKSEKEVHVVSREYLYRLPRVRKIQ